MKKFIVPLILLHSACSKIDIEQISTAKTAEFTSYTWVAYINEPLFFSPLDSSGKPGNYRFDFGDGSNSSGKYSTMHAYNRGGNFKVTLNADDKSFSKNIRILPGHISYQINNKSGKALDLLFYLDNYHSGTLRRDSLMSLERTDTLYAISSPMQERFIFNASLFFKNREYIIAAQDQNDVFLLHRHSVFSISDSTPIRLRNANDTVHFIVDLK